MADNRDAARGQSRQGEDPVAADLDSFAEELEEQIAGQTTALYSEVVVRHGRQPINLGAMNEPDGHAIIRGPCGDTMEIFLRISDGRVTDASFVTDGCTPSVASGSMAVELAMGKSLVEVMGISQEQILTELGGLPEESRHCALLAASTLGQAARDAIDTAREPWKRAYRLPRVLS